MQYVHFTDISGARGIIQDKTIRSSSFSSEPLVYAVAVGGKYVPGVQRTKLGRAKNRNAAVVFETNITPDVAFVEEVIWYLPELPISNPHAMPADKAAELLDDSLPSDIRGMLTVKLEEVLYI